MKDLDAFLPKIEPLAPGVGAPTAYSAIRDAAIEFCERTGLWRWEDDLQMTFTDGEEITAPYGSVLLSIEQVQFNGRPLEPKSVAWMDKHMLGWRAGAVAGAPSYLCQVEPNTLRIAPFTEGKVSIYAKLKPAQDCRQLPDFMADLYMREIAWGALAEILILPNQPYTNLAVAGAMRSRFEGRLDALQRQGTRGQQGARTRSPGTYY